MATYKNGILGPIEGKAGPVHGSLWKGIPVLKGPYKKRTKKVSIKEAHNRFKFTIAQRWLQPVTEFVKEGFKDYTDTFEGFNAAKSLIYHAFEGEGENLRINPAYVLISHGKLTLPEDMELIQPNDRELKLTWNTKLAENANHQDQLMLLAYNVEERRAYGTVYGDFRKTGESTLRLPKSKGNYQVYAAFVSQDRKSRSNSRYLGVITL